MSNSKLVLLDADVIIHFFKGGKLSLIPEIVSPHKLCLLKAVYDEILPGTLKSDVDKLITFKLIEEAEITDNDEIYFEALEIGRNAAIGEGEAACLAYARFTNKIIASSNLKDITDYCNKHSITYLTTLDLLAIAKEKGLLTKDECNQFTVTVRKKNSNIKVIDIDHHIATDGSKMHIFND
ncbi:hypothetical protein [Gracilimonas sp.]|uniref:hypothetical protein n=1 Tax=Gracilimonas sp. TaxID=1974203 RepID=UPI003BAAC7E6